MIDIKQPPYNALGDGITNDRAAIQQAFNDAEISHDTVIIPSSSGDYLVDNNLSVGSNVTIQWVGNRFIKLTKPTSTGAVLTSKSVTEPTLTPFVENINVINPHIDANNEKTNGENGIGFAHCKNVQISGGHIKNCKKNSSGGKGINFEIGVKMCSVSNVFVENCSFAFFTQGIDENDTFGRDRIGTNIIFSNVKAENCDTLFGFFSTLLPITGQAGTMNCIVNGFTAKNVGKTGGIITLDRYANAQIQNGFVYNEANYNEENAIPAFIKGRGTNILVQGISIQCKSKNIISAFPVGAIGPEMKNCSFNNIFWTGEIVDFAIDGENGKIVNCSFNDFKINSYPGDILGPGGQNSINTYGSFYEMNSGKKREGLLSNFDLYDLNDFNSPFQNRVADTNVITNVVLSQSTGPVINGSVDQDFLFRRNDKDIAILTKNGLKTHGSEWNGRHLIMGDFHFWINGGSLYIKNGAPTSATDGTIIGP